MTLRCLIVLAVMLPALACRQGKPPANFPEQNSPGYRLLQTHCVLCHGAPHPESRTAAQWQTIVERMQWQRERLGYGKIDSKDLHAILHYLQKHAAN